MSNRARIISGIVAAVVIVGAFVILNGSSDSGEESKPDTTTQARTEPTGGATVRTTVTTAELPSVTVKDGKPVGGVKTLTYKKGELIEFAVFSDTDEEVHVHGYDIEKEAGHEGSANFSFEADIEGIFEVELHSNEQEILRLKVTP